MSNLKKIRENYRVARGSLAPIYAIGHAAACDGLAGGIAKKGAPMLKPNH
jgi:hypothetical protein